MSDHVARTIAVYEEIADSYNRKIDNYAPRPEREKFLALLPPHAKILDAGCGPGRDSGYFAEKGLIVTGVDLSEKFLALARNRSPSGTFVKQDLRNLDFPKNSFDGIWCCASLLHLHKSEIPGVLTTFCRLLRENGLLFVMVKEGTGEAEVADKLSPHLKRHFIYFLTDELRSLLVNAGFEVLEIYTWHTEERKQDRDDLVWISGFFRKKS